MTGSDMAFPSKPEGIWLSEERIHMDASERDPGHINDHIKIQFQDIIAEPDTEAHSSDKVWILSDKVFATTKLWTYRVLSLALAVPCAAYWGCQFASLAFCHVWCCMPCLRVCDIKLMWVRRFCYGCNRAFIAPFAENIGKCFWNSRPTITTTNV